MSVNLHIHCAQQHPPVRKSHGLDKLAQQVEGEVVKALMMVVLQQLMQALSKDKQQDQVQGPGGANGAGGAGGAGGADGRQGVGQGQGAQGLLQQFIELLQMLNQVLNAGKKHHANDLAQQVAQALGGGGQSPLDQLGQNGQQGGDDLSQALMGMFARQVAEAMMNPNSAQGSQGNGGVNGDKSGGSGMDGLMQILKLLEQLIQALNGGEGAQGSQGKPQDGLGDVLKQLMQALQGDQATSGQDLKGIAQLLQQLIEALTGKKAEQGGGSEGAGGTEGTAGDEPPLDIEDTIKMLASAIREGAANSLMPMDEETERRISEMSNGLRESLAPEPETGGADTDYDSDSSLGLSDTDTDNSTDTDTDTDTDSEIDETESAGTTPSTGGSQGAAGVSGPPPIKGEKVVNETIVVKAGEVFDGKGMHFKAGPALGDGGQGEGQKPVFVLEPGAQIKNVQLSGADGIHAKGDAKLDNVWWRDVGEDAFTMKGKGNVEINGGGAFNANDKIFQLNAGGSFKLNDFTADTFGKAVRTNGGKEFPIDIEVTNSSFKNGKEAIVRSDATQAHIKLAGNDIQSTPYDVIAPKAAQVEGAQHRGWKDYTG